MRTVDISAIPERMACEQPEVYAPRPSAFAPEVSEMATLLLDAIAAHQYLGVRHMLGVLGQISKSEPALRYTLIALSGRDEFRGASFSERGNGKMRTKQAEHQSLCDSVAFIARIDAEIAELVREWHTPTINTDHNAKRLQL